MIGHGISIVSGGSGPPWSPAAAGDQLRIRQHALMGIGLDGTELTTWTNQGSAGGSFNQGVAGKLPLWAGESVSNGRQCVTLDGADDFLSAVGVASIAAGKHTIYAVVESSDTANYLFDANTGRLIIVPARTGTVSHYDGAWKGVGATSTALQALIWQLDSAALSTYYRDGVSLGNVTYTDTAIDGARALGSNATGSAVWWAGKLCEFGVFHPALPKAVAENQLANYLRREWGTP